HSSIDHFDPGLDEAKPLQRDVGCFAINEPRAEDAEEAEADEQHGHGNCGKANCFLEDWHAGSDVLFWPRHCYRLTRGGRDYRRLFSAILHNPPGPLWRNEPRGMASSLRTAASPDNQ